MEESEKAKKQKLQELEAITRVKNKIEIKELLEKIGDYNVSLDDYIEATNTEVSFKISIKDNNEED
ncbi:hypothetical protein [Kordia sp.]|uniref:hypothetical protein n=1 Tax=Kordia sp. TaxID=1965332 RepID=UPI003D2765F7